MELWVQFLSQSGFCVEFPGRTLVFDPDTPQAVPARALSQKQVDVFVSHSHADHFSPGIFAWQTAHPQVRYLLSDDIPPQKGAKRIGPRQRIVFDGIEVSTLRSTDLGVAFLLQLPGCTLYHAGDLNFWHWDGENPAWNRQMAQDYRAEIARLRGLSIDLAFLPLDPRLGRAYLWGIDTFLRTVAVKKVIPMHFGEDFSVISHLEKDPQAASYRDRVVPLHRHGERIRIKV